MDPETPSRRPFLSGTKTIDILHVDDDPDFASLVSTFLERAHDSISVRTETDPAEALSLIRTEPTAFDCVVSDYDMPGMTGIYLLERVREDRPDLPFILFTGKGSEEVASEAIAAGVTDYLQKGGGRDQYDLLANRAQNAVERYWADTYLDRGIEAIETAQDGISILDEDGYVEYINAAGAEMLGYDREETLGLHWETFYDDERVGEVYDELLPKARTGRWKGTTSFIRKDGTELVAEHGLSYTDDGSLICTLSNPRRDADAAVGQSVKEQAMDEAPIGIVLTDPAHDDNPIIYANDAFEELTGYDKNEVIGRNCRFLQGERTSEDAVSKLRTAIDAAEPTTVELRNYRADGTPFWNRVRVAPVFDDAGSPEAFVGFQDDVTQSKARAEKLSKHSAYLEALFEFSPDMVAVHDADGVIRNVNERFHETLGYEKADALVGKTVWDLDPTVDPEHAEPFWENLEPNTPRRFEGELNRRDGTTIPIEISLIRLDVDGTDLFLAIDRDISAQKRREDTLVERNEQLDRFADVVSHDLRNPLAVARGRLDLLREECDSDHIDDIAAAHDRMDALVEDLRAIARDGDEAMNIEPVAVAAVAAECWTTVPTGRATLEVRATKTIDADVEQLRQLLENLVRNAVEHGGDAVTVTIGDTPDGFYVEDDGPGIPENDRDTVFERGYSTSADGTGLGLSIVEQVVDAHGWEISITSAEGGGTRFEIVTS
ncbi:PAS domain S-box protein [Halorubrum laminariae]|uniref:histidine kinase n=1 Tax=Halorubrum laminariae TaxID=1433523 RepID=A0ABD6C4Z4_9EURY|nr:PAS domain S-box protein [Halorubrum laminariae]